MAGAGHVTAVQVVMVVMVPVEARAAGVVMAETASFVMRSKHLEQRSLTTVECL